MGFAGPLDWAQAPSSTSTGVLCVCTLKVGVWMCPHLFTGPKLFLPQACWEPMRCSVLLWGCTFMRRWVGTLPICPHFPTQEWQEQNPSAWQLTPEQTIVWSANSLECQIPFRNHLKMLPSPCSSHGFPKWYLQSLLMESKLRSLALIELSWGSQIWIPQDTFWENRLSF